MSADPPSAAPMTNVIAFPAFERVCRAEPICLEVVATCAGDPGRLFATARTALDYIARTRGTEKALGPQRTTNGPTIALLALCELLGVTVREGGEV